MLINIYIIDRTPQNYSRNTNQMFFLFLVKLNIYDIRIGSQIGPSWGGLGRTQIFFDISLNFSHLPNNPGCLSTQRQMTKERDRNANSLLIVLSYNTCSLYVILSKTPFNVVYIDVFFFKFVWFCNSNYPRAGTCTTFQYLV